MRWPVTGVLARAWCVAVRGKEAHGYPARIPGLRFALLMLIAAAPAERAAGDEAGMPDRSPRDTIVSVSPLFGWNRNEVMAPREGAPPEPMTDTAPQYGLFLLLHHKNLVLTDFVFFTHVNNTDVFGNFAFANLYGDRWDRFAWNIGAGHLYHALATRRGNMTVHVPMVKAGVLIQIPEWRLTLNPYVGHAWEFIRPAPASMDKNGFLYGITAGWRWRMLGATVQYYYQDNRRPAKDTHTLRARAHGMFTRHWGAVVRFDYKEHSIADDTSVLFGPVYVF